MPVVPDYDVKDPLLLLIFGIDQVLTLANPCSWRRTQFIGMSSRRCRYPLMIPLRPTLSSVGKC
jgi:hypothetical protein